jgi:hypothetical protein
MAKKINAETNQADPFIGRKANSVPQLKNPDYVRLLRQATAMSLAQFAVMKGSAPTEVRDWVTPILDEPQDDNDASELLQLVMNYEANNEVTASGTEQKYITELRSALAGFVGLCLKESGTDENGKPNLPTSKAAVGWMIKAMVDGMTAGISTKITDFFTDVKPLEAELGF